MRLWVLCMIIRSMYYTCSYGVGNFAINYYISRVFTKLIKKITEYEQTRENNDDEITYLRLDDVESNLYRVAFLFVFSKIFTIL